MNNEHNFQSHKISVIDRRTAELTGINDVISFDDNSITAHSALGDMIIEGEELKIDNFSSEKGLLTVIGKMNGIYYLEHDTKKRFSKKHGSDRL